LNPVEENITVLTCSILSQEGFTENRVALSSTVVHDVQYELVSAGNVMAVICFSGLEAIDPMDFNS